MGMRYEEEAAEYIDKLSKEDAITLAKVAVLRLMEIDEVSYRKPSSDLDRSHECVYWDGSGESLLY